MSLFLVPKLPIVYFCSFFPSVFFNFNDITLLRLFFKMLALVSPNRGSGEGGGKKRRKDGEGGKARMYLLVRNIQKFKMG